MTKPASTGFGKLREEIGRGDAFMASPRFLLLKPGGQLKADCT